MIVVTGTKRSGTSMWMQILSAAGFEVLGKKFPGPWEKFYADVNPGGFYEDRNLRTGVPENMPVLDDNHALKIFVGGLVRTPEWHFSRVIATMRDHREFEASFRRFWAFEDKVGLELGLAPQPRIVPVLEWFSQNAVLLGDTVRRRYLAHWVAYDNVLEYPQDFVYAALHFLGRTEATEAAVKAVTPEWRTQSADARMSFPPIPGEPENLPVSLFDEMYQRALYGEIYDLDFLERVARTHQALSTVYANEKKRSRTALEAAQADHIQNRPKRKRASK